MVFLVGRVAMTDEQQERLQRLLEEERGAQRALDRIKGGLQQLLRDLKTLTGTKDISEAKRQIEELKRREQQLSKDYDAACDRYEQDFGRYLEDINGD